MGQASETVTIEETTVGRLSGARVGMGNLCQDDFVRADGSRGHGWVCSLAIDGAVGVFVGPGSRVEAGGATWEVLSVTRREGALGEVALARVG
jgi:hypothetical protein